MARLAVVEVTTNLNAPPATPIAPGPVPTTTVVTFSSPASKAAPPTTTTVQASGDATAASAQPSSTPKPARNTATGVYVGVGVGLTVSIVLVAVCMYFKNIRGFFTRLIMRIRRLGMDSPEKDDRWDVFDSRDVSTEGSLFTSTSASALVSKTGYHSYPTPQSGMRDANLSLSLVSTTNNSPPPLHPNRRPPSSILSAERALPPVPDPISTFLPRLEPNRRLPSRNTVGRRPSSTTLTSLGLPLQEPEPESEIGSSHESHASVAPSTGSSAMRASARKPLSFPMAVDKPLPVPVPEPVRLDHRHSSTSAYTTVSTALSDMSILKPGSRTPAQVEMHRSLALARLAPPPLPPMPRLPSLPPMPPLPVDIPPTLPLRIQPKRTSLSPPERHSLALGRTSTPVEQPPDPPTPTARSPHAPTTSSRSPPAAVMHVSPPASSVSPSYSSYSSTSPSLSSRSRSRSRKPVPPLDPSDTPSSASIWTGAKRYSYASTTAWDDGGEGDSGEWSGRAGWGSPVPSSRASQMYKSRESAQSDWTWSRPLEDWEREQLSRRAAESVIGGGGGGSMGSSGPSAGASAGRSGSGSVRRTSSTVSFGEMKPMWEVVPDVPPLPSSSRHPPARSP